MRQFEISFYEPGPGYRTSIWLIPIWDWEVIYFCETEVNQNLTKVPHKYPEHWKFEENRLNQDGKVYAEL